MNEQMPLMDKLKKQLAFWLSAGVFCLMAGGCAFREAEVPSVEAHLPPSMPDRPAPAVEFAEKPEEPAPHESARPEKEKPFPHHRERDPQYITVPTDRSISSEAAEWISIYESRFGEGSSENVILDGDAIREYNRRMVENCPALYDMAKIPAFLPRDEVESAICRYAFPAGEKYDRTGQHIDEKRRERIRENCNLTAIPDEVIPRRAIVTSRCDMKAFPTELGFYDSGDTYYSRIQETELITGFPVWVLHNSTDGKFLFVQSYYYAGWVEAQHIAYCGEEIYQTFTDPQSFVTVTAAVYTSGEVRLDMGTVLPYAAESDTAYTVLHPQRDEDGSVLFTELEIPKTEAVYGYLPYNMKNYYTQAFAFLGTSYGWGGADGGVDCSGFVCSVFRTFGLYLPRNTGEQSQYAGEILNLARQSAEESQAVLWNVDTPATVHRKGHVMLYLGSTGGKYYIIHAPRGGDIVSVAAITLPGTYTVAVQVH